MVNCFRTGPGGGASSPGSNVSAVSTTGRRYLEWDYGSDLGLQYHTQGEAAASLSQLEKMAITSYTKHLDPEDERRKSKGGHSHHQMPPDFGDTGADLLGEKISKFTDSLMRHRQLHQPPRPSVIRARPETVRPTEADVRPGSSSRRSPVKSSSLGSLAESGQQQQLGNSRCSSSVSCHSLTAGPAALVSGPSSSSSAGTIVARQDHRQVPGLSDVMRKLSMDILEDSDQDPHLNIDPDTQSTVSTMEDEPLISNTKPLSSKNSSSSSPPEKPKSVWNPSNDESFSNFKTFHHDDNVTQQDKEGFRGYYRRSPSGHSRSSQLRDHDQSQRSSVLSANHRPGASHLDQSEQSSVPTTSDEEAERPKRLVGLSDGDTSTMESAQAMGADRAKSFEYIPGETFQLQENSSSYEYLPGHLVSDNRPPTVLNNIRPQSLAMPPPPGQPEDRVDKNGDLIPQSLDLLSLELREKSKDLCVKNISQTKHFFKKLKSYIEYLSTPSLTPEDSRVKQELAERIMALLANEETRLGAGLSSGLTSREMSVRSLALESSEAKRSGETSTRQMQTDAQPLGAASRSRVGKDNDLRTRSGTGHETTDLSSLSSELKESDNSSRMSDWKMDKTKSELEYQLKQGGLDSTEAVEIVQKLQRKRLEHMKKLKKEMKKLEKIDSLIVGAAVGGKPLPDVTDSSVASSVTSVRSEEVSLSLTADSGAGSASRVIRATKTVTSKNIVTVNSETRSQASKSKSKSKARKHSTEKENKTPTPPSQIVMEEISPIITVPRSPKRNKSPPQRMSSNFGQVYPSGSDTNTLTDSNVETLNSNGTFITKKSPKHKRRSPKKTRNQSKNVPVAYYLPVDNLSPVRIGTRVLRERNGWLGSGQRDILTSYMASLDTQPLKRPPANTSSDVSRERSEVVGLSLQQALVRRRPGFVRGCEARVEAMRRAREARQLRAEKQAAWVEDLARQSPRSQRMAQPSFTPVPIVRVFNHR